MAKTKFSPAVQAFAHSLAVSSPRIQLAEEDTHDDLKREDAIVQQALAAASKAKDLLATLGFVFGAPEGYFCEMLKTEEQMGKIKKVADAKVEASKAAELARKQRQLKKFGKQVQTETLMERAKDKKEQLAKIAQLRKKRKTAEGTDQFDIDVDSDDGAQVQKKKVIKGGRMVTVERQVGAKRDYKNKKFSFGGKKWDSKKNTRDSTDDFDFNPSKNKKAFAGTESKAAGGKKAAAKRPGKQRRQQIRSKIASKRR